jgi:hypothetical protein
MHQTMTENHKPTSGAPTGKVGIRPDQLVAQPDWANGLRNIYNSIVSEPLPSDMLKLLASLDEEEDEGK